MANRRFREGALGEQFGTPPDAPAVPDTAPAQTSITTTTPSEQAGADFQLPPQPYTGDVVQNIQSLAGVQQWMMGLSFTQTPGVDVFFANEPGGTPPPAAYTNTGIDYGVYSPAQTTFVTSPELTTLGTAQPGPAQFGLEGNLTQVQLAEASRLTAISMFGPYFNQNLTGALPNKISQEVADELAGFIINPQNENLQNAYFENFGVTGFESTEQFLETLGYIEVEDGEWWLPPVDEGASAAGGFSYTPTNYGRNTFGYNYSPRGAYAGGNLVNWRI